MKKLFLCFVFLFIWSGVKGQNNPTYFDTPKRMAKDTLLVASSRTVRDFYINTADDSLSGFYNDGTIDLAIIGSMVGENTATITIDAYGIVLKKYEITTVLVTGALDSSKTFIASYIDSTRIGTLSANDVLNVFAVDGLFTTFKMYDGIRFVYKTSVQDSVVAWSNIRNRFKWWDGR